MTGADRRRPALSQTGIEVVASLAEHRVLSTNQVNTMHLPGGSRRWTQKVLARLSDLRLAGRVDSGRSPRRLWHATERGAELAIEAHVLERVPRVVGAEQAAGPLQAHTFALNEAAICFLEAARERNDEFGPFAWRHEIYHPMSRGRGRQKRWLTADATFTYLREDDDGISIEQRFLELDRATLSVDRLFDELARYGELYAATDHDGEPLWRERYPAFPPVLCVLTGAERAVLERRRASVNALLRIDPRLTAAGQPQILTCLLEDLKEGGPFAPVFRDIRNPAQPVNWVGETTSGDDDV